MKIFLTGATGFLGAHIARELFSHGHDLRLLVRDEQALRNYFSAINQSLNDVVIGDMRDQALIAEALQGCDAVIHSAALVDLNPSRETEVYRTNLDGTRTVIGAAIAAGVSNIIYVSSNSVLFQPNAKTIAEDGALAELQGAYARSKIDCERWVRSRQEEGAPIQISYPGGVYGPDDPKLSESNAALLGFIKSFMLRTSSGTMCADVRDLARLHRWLVETPPNGAFANRRFLMAGHYQSWDELHQLLQTIIGREISAKRVSGRFLRLTGRLLDVARRFRTIETPMTAETMAIMTQCSAFSSKKITELSGLEFRPTEETLTDTIQWLLQRGYLKSKHVPALLNGA